MEVQAYCMKCRAERTVKDAEVITTKNGRTAAQGTCPVCGTKMFKFLPKAKAAIPDPAPANAAPEPAPDNPTPTA